MRALRSAFPFGVPLAVALPMLAFGACDRPAGPPGSFEVRAESLVIADSALRYTASLTYPQIDGDGPGVEATNRALADTARAMVDLYRPPEPPPPELGEEFAFTLEGGFETYLLRDSLFSGLLSAYAYTGGAHGNEDIRPLNYDLRTGRPIVLESLFRRGSAWPDTLALWSTQALIEFLGHDVLFANAVPATPETFRVFSLAPDSLVFTFPPYAVAPYAVGPQRAAFAWTALRPLLDADGPARYFVGRPAPAVEPGSEGGGN